MGAELSERGEALLEEMPAHYRDDPTVWAVVDTGARELERLEEHLVALREQAFPHRAGARFALLALWELTLGLPVALAGVPESARRAKVIAAYRRRQLGGSGAAWVELVTEALGSGAWTHEENSGGDYVLRIEIPGGDGEYTSGQVEALLEQITPAHLELVVDFGGHFRVGISQVGDPL